MVPWLRFNLAETISVQPLQGRSQAQQKAQLGKAPTVEAEGEENPMQRKWQEAQRAGNWDSKNKQQEAHGAQSQIPGDLRLR